jgi:hypothetical protein
MKANVQRTIDQLKPSERKRLDEMIFDRLDEELVIAQFNWIKLGCYSLSQIEGITKEQILMWIGGFKRLYQQNSRFKTQAELTEFLDKRMAEIFGEGGFPEEYMQSFKEIGRS